MGLTPYEAARRWEEGVKRLLRERELAFGQTVTEHGPHVWLDQLDEIRALPETPDPHEPDET